MEERGFYCEECVEDIPENHVFWEGERAYCGKCGSELDMDSTPTDMLDQIEDDEVPKSIATNVEDDDDGEDEAKVGFGDAFASDGEA